MATDTTTAPDAPAALGEMIVATPGTCSGEPRIAGTRIKVRRVYDWVEVQEMTPAEVVAEYPHLSRAAVHAALAYYWSHPDEIHRAIEDEDRRVAAMRAAAGLSLVAQKLAERERANAANDSIPHG